MTANVGRTIIVFWGDEDPQPAVAGIKEKSVSFSGEAVDITNDDSGGWRELLDAAGVNGVEISCSGVALDDTLRADWFSGASATGKRMQKAAFQYKDGGKIAGTFYLQEYSETGNHDDQITFEATFLSSGVVTYTPAAAA
jgi:TP901-1 family phage major tail protein